MQEKLFSIFKYFTINKYFHKFIPIIMLLLVVTTQTASSSAKTNPLLSSRDVLSTTYSLASENSSSVILKVAETSASINKGQKARYSINIDRSNFPNAVELGLSQLNGAPTPGITFSYSKSTTTENSVTLDIATNEQTPAGAYNFVVTGKALGITINDSNKITLVVNKEQDIFLAISPDTLTATPGQTANFTLTSNTFLENSALSVTGLPPNTTSSFSNNKRTVSLSINTSSNTPLGSYNFTVTGVFGDMTRKISANLVVQTPLNTVTLQVNQPTMSIGQGQTANYLVSINRSNVTAPVELGLVSLSSSIPGLTFSYSQNPTTASSANLSISTTTNTPSGIYTFEVTAKASGLTIANSNTITLAVTSPSQDFSLSFSPNSVSVRQGLTTSLSINRVNIGGSNNPISLNVTGLPAGVTTNLPTGNNFPLSLQITTSADTPLGTYNITVTGIRGGFTRSASASLTVQSATPNIPQSVRVQIDQSSLTVTQGEIAKYSVNINRTNFSSPVTLGLRMLNGTSVPGLSVIYSQNPTTANNVGLNLATSSNTPAGTYNFVLTGRASGININDSSIFTLIVKSAAVQQPDFSLSLSPSSLTIKAGETANFTLIRTDSNGFSSNISVSVAGLPLNSINGLPTSFSFPISLPIITSTDTPVGTYAITVSGLGGGLTRTTTATLQVEALTIPKSVALQANQTLATINQGQSINYPISINRTNFTEPVELGLKILNATTIPGLTFGYSQNPTTANNVNLNIATTNSIPVGTYNFVVTGKASGLAIADSNVFTLVVNSNIQADFTLSLSPSSLTVKPGETATYTLNRNNIGGFSSNVVLSISGLPSGATSNVSSISGSSISLPVITSNNTPIGNYTLTITGVSGNLTRTVSASLVVELVKPAISSVSYIKPFLNINGANFGTEVRVFVNNKEVTSFIRNLSASLVELKGNKKKLGLVTGSNQIKLISNGVESNTVLVSAFKDETLVFLGEEIINTNVDDYFSKRTPKAFDSTDDESEKNQPLVEEEKFGVRED